MSKLQTLSRVCGRGWPEGPGEGHPAITSNSSTISVIE